MRQEVSRMSKEEKSTYTIKADENLGEVKIADDVVSIIAGKPIKRRKTAFLTVFLRLKYEFQISPDHISKVVNCSKDCAQ